MEIETEKIIEALYLELMQKSKQDKKTTQETKPERIKSESDLYVSEKPENKQIDSEPLRYSLDRTQIKPSYISRWETDRRDFTKLAPGKKVQVLDLPHGLYGYTFLHRNEMVISSKVVEPFKYEVDVHESIHTPDEYETRAITAWMLQEQSDDPYLLEQRPLNINY